VVRRCRGNSAAVVLQQRHHRQWRRLGLRQGPGAELPAESRQVEQPVSGQSIGRGKWADATPADAAHRRLAFARVVRLEASSPFNTQYESQ
jgi:hypothetical protein